MEFTASQIARLVLGYLKTEKCQAAFDNFFNTSPHFGSNKNPKYMVTRVQGYSLRDFLNQYAQIYNIIQESLEPTDYFDEHTSRNIIDQLKYLLEKCGRTRPNTPLRSRSSTPIKEANRNKSLFQQNLSVIEEDVTSELNTTPLEALPGNSKEFCSTPKKRGGIKTNKNTVVEESDSGDSPDNCREEEEEEDIEVLKQTLLERTELHEKIAENINLVIKPEEKVNNELESAIKAIVEKTEADPIFEKLISDLICSTAEDLGIDRDVLDQNNVQHSKSAQTCVVEQQILHKQSEKGTDTIKSRLRTPKKQPGVKSQEHSSSFGTDQICQTAKVSSGNIQEATNAKPAEVATQPIVDPHKYIAVNATASGDIIVYDGTLDNFMKTSTTSVINPANPMLVSNNLVMVQPSLIQSAPMTGPLISSVPVDKSYYVVNNSQVINVSVPQYKLNSITEQDILNMPTVFVYDDNNRQASQQTNTRPATKKSGTKEPVKILPKESLESRLQEYVTLHPNSTKDAVSKENEAKPSVEPAEKAPSPRTVTPDGSKQAIRKATPKSGSHVRALDFSLTPGQSKSSAKKPTSNSKSPRKKSPTKTSTTKISKSLFGSPSKQAKTENVEAKHEQRTQEKASSKQNKLKGWDSDLRALVGPVKDATPPKRKRKESNKRSSKRTKNLNSTENDAKTIEANLKDMDLETEVSQASEIKNEHSEELVTVIAEEVTKEETQNYSERTENYEESLLTVALINCNAKPRFKKKCNTDNNINKAVKLTKVKEIKSLEIVPDGSNKLILSPSKLNANKRTLVENIDSEISLVVAPSVEPLVTAAQDIIESKVEVTSFQVTAGDVKNHNEGVTVQSTNETEKKDNVKFITPDMPRVPNALPVTANRNLIPLLETPMKFMDTSIKLDELPKTPGAYSPSNDTNTPMTKLLNEQLHGVDLLSIPTPKFPLTPTFPFTPFNTKSPYPNRPTDYSTTSSYYHPSDSEQNKSIEALLEECKRLEKKMPTPEKQVNQSPAESPIQLSITEQLSSFNQNLIARKNLSLVKKDLEDSSSCDSSSSNEESSTSVSSTHSSGSLWDNKNDTVVSNRPETPYLLRSRKKEEPTSTKNSEKTTQNAETETEIESKPREQAIGNCKDTIFKEIEEKRQRTIAKFKQGEKPAPRKRGPSANTPVSSRKLARDACGKFIPKSKSKRTQSKTPTTKNAKSTNKRKSKSPVKLTRKTSVNRIIAERDMDLHFSSDDDRIKPFDVVETELLESSSSSTGHPLTTFQGALDSLKSNVQVKESSNVYDHQTKTLVEDLKERGIYLMPKKTSRQVEETANLNSEEADKNNEDTLKVEETKSEKVRDIPVEETVNEINKLQDGVGTITNNTPKPLIEQEKSVAIDTSKLEEVDLKSTTTPEQRCDAPVTEIPNNISKEVKNITSDKQKLDGRDIKSSDAHNDLEEGEILSEEEGSVKDFKNKSHKSNQVSARSTKTHSKRSESKRSSAKPPKKESISKSSSRKKDTVRENKKSTESKRPKESTLQQNKRKDNDSRKRSVSESTTKTKNQLPTPKSVPVVNETTTVKSNIEHDLNLTESIIEEVFDDKSYHEETLHIVYDSNKTSGKTLKDYDLPISNKCFVVEVFGHQIEMSVTPFEMVFDRETSVNKSHEKVKILQNTVITTGSKPSPLDMLHAHLNKRGVEPISPLDNLYSPGTSASYTERSMQRLKVSERRRRNSVDQRREPARKSTRSKSVDCNTIAALPKIEESLESLNTNKDERLDDAKKETTAQTNSKIDVIENIDGALPVAKPSPREIDDELMNYAICGSEREENDTEERPNKRKPTDEPDGSQLKRIKAQVLLDDLNVDAFLTEIHG